MRKLGLPLLGSSAYQSLDCFRARHLAYKAMAHCTGCAAVAAVLHKLNPSDYRSDDQFYCQPCWVRFAGSVPANVFSMPPAGCANCGESRGCVLYAYDPYDAASDLSFYCKPCWQARCGDVPGKVVQWPADISTFSLQDEDIAKEEDACGSICGVSCDR